MALLKLKIASLDDINEAHRGLYIEDEDGDGFVLDTDAVDDIGKLSGVVVKERNNRKEAEKRAKANEDRFEGIDPDEYRAMKEREEDREAEKAEKEGTTKQREAKLRTEEREKSDERNAGKIKELEDRGTFLLSELDRVLVDGETVRSLAKYTDKIAMMTPSVKPSLTSIEIDKEGGGTMFVTRVVDAAGEERFGPKGEPMTPDQLVEEMRDNKEYAVGFLSDGSSGSGATSRDVIRSKHGKGVDTSKMTGAEIYAAARKAGAKQ